MSSSVHLHPPFRAEHVGSLLRPKALYEKRQALEAKKCSPSDLKPVEDEAIKHVLKLQQDIGIKTITDGELRRLVGKKYRSLSASVHTINA
jgi:methionine synthase II (cobalamin-independent)